MDTPHDPRPARATVTLLLLMVLVLLPVPVSAATSRGELLSVTPVTRQSRDQIAAVATEVGIDARRARHAAVGYRITYRTVDANGRPAIASGLVVVPDTGRRRLHTVVYAHGTRAFRGGVASVGGDGGDRAAAMLLGSAGFAVVAPDYLGLGTGTGHHPYMHAGTEASASLDMLSAADRLLERHGRDLRPGVLVTGFSQGGHAAMALGRALQDDRGDGWDLRALAPISGPYAVQDVELPALLTTGEVDPAVGAFYAAYWTVSMDRLYDLYDVPSEVFRPPYDTTMEVLFDGEHDEGAIFAGLPTTPEQLLTRHYVRRLLRPRGALRRALEDNDATCRWRPRVPVRLYAASGDREVPIANAEHCLDELRDRRADARLIDLGEVGHSASARLGLPAALDWFADLTGSA